jgi:hypothetical protein
MKRKIEEGSMANMMSSMGMTGGPQNDILNGMPMGMMMTPLVSSPLTKKASCLCAITFPVNVTRV